MPGDFRPVGTNRGKVRGAPGMREFENLVIEELLIIDVQYFI
jgi:hypothetical protein